MASNYQASETTNDASEYLNLLGFWKETWFRAFIVIEVILFGGGYLVSTQGTVQAVQMARQHPDVHYALGGVMGALGVLFGAVLLVFVAVSVYLRLRNIVEPDVEF